MSKVIDEFDLYGKHYVLETGEITLHGTGAELLTNEAVKRAYLGE